MLAAWGRLIHRRRRLVLALSGVLLLATVAVVSRGAEFSSSTSVDSDSRRASLLIGEQLPPGNPGFVVVASSRSLNVDDPGFAAALQSALAPLRSDAHVVSVTTPFDTPGPPAAARVSTDRHHALVNVGLTSRSHSVYREVRGRLRSPSLDLAATGGPAVESDYDRILNDDVARGETLSIPLSLLLLVLVFGSVIAALLPVGVAILATMGGLAVMTIITGLTSVDSSASNVVVFLGLGLGIDYSLFVVTRFREELQRGAAVDKAIARSLATAGRAIAVSGLTVAIGLAGLLFFTGTFLPPFGFAVMAVVFFALLYSFTFLPAVLCMLGTRIDRLRVRPRRTPEDVESGMWHRLATTVMRHPIAVLVPCVAVLLLPLVAFTQIRFGTDHLNVLPRSAESRVATELIRANFPAQQQDTITVVARFDNGLPPLAPENVGALYDLGRRIERVPGVLRVDDIVPDDRGISRAQYQALYQQPLASLPAEARNAVRQSIGTTIAVMRVQTAAVERSVAARDLVNAVRDTASIPGGQVLVTGQTAFDVDYVSFIDHRAPLALAFVVLATYVVLLLLFGSILLPLKAVLMNLLSITASFGALVFVFQQGHLSGLLDFMPGPIDPVVPVILFCILFGLSMDYEVFLLTRIQEEYRASGDNRRGVALGLERSGRVVTGAAAIMIAVVVCFGLGTSETLKIIGLGMTLAVLVDATIVRALVVPAVMRLMGRADWWAPPWVHRLQRLLRLAG